jgi:hypothetical protein
VYFLKLASIFFFFFFVKYVFSCFLKNGYFGNFDMILIQGERERERERDYIIFYNILDISFFFLFFFISFVDSDKKKSTDVIVTCGRLHSIGNLGHCLKPQFCKDHFKKLKIYISIEDLVLSLSLSNYQFHRRLGILLIILRKNNGFKYNSCFQFSFSSKIGNYVAIAFRSLLQ